MLSILILWFIFNSTLSDTELNGYFIPKDTDVLAVLWAVDHNESLWGKDVFDYKPERFLSADGQKVVKPEHFIPFSIGKYFHYKVSFRFSLKNN